MIFFQKLQIIILTILLLSVNILSGQKSKHSVSVYAGYAYGEPDKRLDFLHEYPLDPIQTVIDRSARASLDNEYSIGINYIYSLSGRLKLGFGVGYAQLVQDFPLPANGNSFFGSDIYPFFWRDTSYYHMIQLTPNINFDLINYKSLSLGITTSLINNISFKKEIQLFRLSTNKTEYFATEIYPGIYMSVGRFRIQAERRAFHWKYRDDAIANNGLNPDTYNPTKWRFLLSYEFLRLKRN